MVRTAELTSRGRWNAASCAARGQRGKAPSTAAIAVGRGQFGIHCERARSRDGHEQLAGDAIREVGFVLNPLQTLGIEARVLPL